MRFHQWWFIRCWMYHCEWAWWVAHCNCLKQQNCLICKYKIWILIFKPHLPIFEVDTRVRWTRTNQSTDTFVRPCPRTRSGHGHHNNWNRGHGHENITYHGYGRGHGHAIFENSRTWTWRGQSADTRVHRTLADTVKSIWHFMFRIARIRL